MHHVHVFWLQAAPLPQGSPAWITPELIAQTIDTWAPYYDDNLTPECALEILMAADRLFCVLEHIDDG